MLAELALATAAFKTVKEFVQEGKDLHQMGEGLFNYFDAKSKLQIEVNKSQKSDKSDLEEFMALETIKEQENELRELMIYTGRAGLHGDFIKYQADARKARKAAEIQAKKEREEAVETITTVVGVGIGVSIVLGGLGALIYYVKGF